MLFERVLFCCIIATRMAAWANIMCSEKNEHNYARAGKFLARAAMSSVLDTAALYLQRVMQLVAGGFLYASITASDHGKFI